MVFYGITSNSDQQIKKLEEEIVALTQQREIMIENNLGTLQK